MAIIVAVGLWQHDHRGDTSTSRLEIVDGNPASMLLDEFVMPIGGPIDQYPNHGQGTCDPDDVEWLQANAQESPRNHFLRVTSTATSGSALTIADWQTKTHSTSDAVPSFRFACSGAGDSGLVAARANVAASSSVMRIEEHGEAPLAVSIAPGETLTVALALSGRRSADFAVSARVYVGDASGITSLPFSGLKTSDSGFKFVSTGPAEVFDVEPGTGRDPAGDQYFFCVEATDDLGGSSSQCTSWGIVARVARFWQSETQIDSAIARLADASSCSDAKADGARVAQLIEGYSGREGPTGSGIGAPAVEALKASCGSQYALEIATNFPMSLSESGYSELVDAATDRVAPEEVDAAIDEASNLVAGTECTDPLTLGDKIGSVWAERLGASWMVQPSFADKAPGVVRALQGKCGSEFALEAVEGMNVVGPEWRLLSGVLDGTTP